MANNMGFLNETQLLKQAEAELWNEAKRAAVRHSVAGPSGWQPCPKANKSFLTNTLLQTLSSNRLLSRKAAERREKRLGLSVDKKERKWQQKNVNFIYKNPKTKIESEIDIETVLDKKKAKNIKVHSKLHKKKSEKDRVKKKKKKKKEKKKS